MAEEDSKLTENISYEELAKIKRTEIDAFLRQLIYTHYSYGKVIKWTCYRSSEYNWEKDPSKGEIYMNEDFQIIIDDYDYLFDILTDFQLMQPYDADPYLIQLCREVFDGKKN